MTPPTTRIAPTWSQGSLVLHRNQMAWLTVRTLLGLLGLNLVLVVGALVALLLALGRPTAPEYLTLDAARRVLNAPPVSQPIPDTQVLAFSKRAIRILNTYNYAAWKDQIAAAAPLFSGSGWNGYMAQLEVNDTIKAVIARRMVVSVALTGPPTIVQHGHLPNGSFAWRVKVPVRVTYAANAFHDGHPDQGNIQVGDWFLTLSRAPFTLNGTGLEIRVQQFKLDTLPASPPAPQGHPPK